MLRKFPGEKAMPLASTCSAAISAACHRPEADKEAHLLPVQWGVDDVDDQNRGHCTFTTARNVTAPVLVSSYLGMSPPASAQKPSLTVSTIVDKLREATDSLRRIRRRRDTIFREDI